MPALGIHHRQLSRQQRPLSLNRSQILHGRAGIVVSGWGYAASLPTRSNHSKTSSTGIAHSPSAALKPEVTSTVNACQVCSALTQIRETIAVVLDLP